MKHLSSSFAFAVLFASLTGCGSSGSTPSSNSNTSPVGTWGVSPIPGSSSNDLHPVTTWKLVLGDDKSLALQFQYVFPADATSFAGCTYLVESSGGTWATIASNGGTRLHITATQTKTEVRTGCARPSDDFATRPASSVDPSLPILVVGDYPYTVSGNTLTLETAQSAIAFTRE